MRRSRALTAAAALSAAAALALAGCGQVNDALAKQWAVVTFRPDTTVPMLMQVRASCSHIRHVVPLSTAAVSSNANANYSLRYQAKGASRHELAALQTCLEQFHAVIGVSFEDVSDQH